MYKYALALGLILTPSFAAASVIERACMKADRPAATTSLCGCIQQVADTTLTRSEQRKAAKFFKDPHAAQEMRQSDRASHEEFWQRYRGFTDTAALTCSG